MLKKIILIILAGIAIITLSRLADSQFPQAPRDLDGTSGAQANASTHSHSLLKAFLPLP